MVGQARKEALARELTIEAATISDAVVHEQGHFSLGKMPAHLVWLLLHVRPL